MKRIFLLIAVSLFSLAVMGQTVLRESTHGILPGYPNPMILTAADNPGPSGKNVTWDFSGIPQKGAFRGEVADPSVMSPEMDFMKSNTCLIEEHLQAFMVSSRRKLQVLGLRIPTAKMVRVYDSPIVKMKYPFRYGDKYASKSTGREVYSNNFTYDIAIENSLHADAIGTLILPGTTLRNALRVETTQTVTYTGQYGTHTSTVVTYRWYVKSHRYPVLSLIFDRTKEGTLRCVKAAYNPIVEVEALLADSEKSGEEKVSDVKAMSVNARPNPFCEKLTVNYTLSGRSNVIVALYNMQGYLVKTLYQGMQDAGVYETTYTSAVQGLAAGQYILRVETSGKALTQKLIKM